MKGIVLAPPMPEPTPSQSYKGTVLDEEGRLIGRIELCSYSAAQDNGGVYYHIFDAGKSNIAFGKITAQALTDVLKKADRLLLGEEKR